MANSSKAHRTKIHDPIFGHFSIGKQHSRTFKSCKCNWQNQTQKHTHTHTHLVNLLAFQLCNCALVLRSGEQTYISKLPYCAWKKIIIKYLKKCMTIKPQLIWMCADRRRSHKDGKKHWTSCIYVNIYIAEKKEYHGDAPMINSPLKKANSVSSKKDNIFIIKLNTALIQLCYEKDTVVYEILSHCCLPSYKQI